MAEASRSFLRSRAVGRGASYLVKAAVLVGLLYAFGRYAGMLPPAGVAAVWAVLSAVSSLGLAYRHVVRKMIKQQAYYEAGGGLARINNGRFLCLVGSFALSAVFIAGFVLEAPAWEASEWVLVAAAVPVYPLVFLLVYRLMRRQLRPVHRISGAVGWSVWIAGALLCAAYLALCLAQPAATFESAAAAFDSVAQPFADSPSALMREAGVLAAFSDGLAAYGASKAAEVSGAGYLAIKVALNASAFFGVANLLGLCMLGWFELKRVFLPLEAGPASDAGADMGADASVVSGASATAPAPAPVPLPAADAPDAGPGAPVEPAPAVVPAPAPAPAPLRAAVATFVALPIMLAAAFLVADAMVARAAQTQEYTAAERFVRDQMGLAVFVLDGHYYDQAAVEALLEEARVASAALSEEAEATLVPLINASFDARLANVDAYLDWYYSLPADYERLVTMVTGTVEDFMRDQFTANIEAGIDDTALEDALRDLAERAAALEEDTASRLAEFEIAGVPEWLLMEKVPLGPDFMSGALEPSARILSAGERLGLSAGIGIVTGAAAKHVAENLAAKVSEKQFFKEFVKKVAGKLGGRAVSTVVGGAVGTIGGPLGTVVGAAAGTAAGIGLDYGMLKLDEWQNRDSYREEIVQLIEEERSEMLASVQGEPGAEEGPEAQGEPGAQSE